MNSYKIGDLEVKEVYSRRDFRDNEGTGELQLKVGDVFTTVSDGTINLVIKAGETQMEFVRINTKDGGLLVMPPMNTSVMEAKPLPETVEEEVDAN